MTKRNMTNNDIQYTTQEREKKEIYERGPTKTEDEVRFSDRVNSSWSSSDIRRVVLVTQPTISIE
jgi:hypothetical protein